MPAEPKPRLHHLNETLFFSMDHAREAVAERTHTYNIERPNSALGYQAPAVFAAQLTAMGDQLRAPETLRRSPIAPSAQQRQVQKKHFGLSRMSIGGTAERLRLDSLVQSKRGLGLSPDHAGDHPQRVVAPRSVRERPRAFLAPMSNSFRLLPGSFWQALADRLTEAGWQVLVNKGPEGEPPVAGAQPVDLSHAELVGFLDDVDCVIGLRSGLLDVVSSTRAPMIVYYPVPGLNMPWLHMWSLKPLRGDRVTEEIPILSFEYDEAQLLRDSVRLAQRFAKEMTP